MADPTTKKRTRRLNLQALGQLFERLSVGVLMAEAKTGRILHWSPMCSNLLGHTPQQALGKPLHLFSNLRCLTLPDGTNPDDNQSHYRRHHDVQGHQGQPLVLDELYLPESVDETAQRLVLVSAPGVLPEDQHPLRTAAAQLALADSTETMGRLQLAATVLENSNEGIILTDHEARVLLVNPAFSKITGFEPQEVLGLVVNVLRADLYDPVLKEEIWDNLVTLGRWEGEYWNRRKDGRPYPEWLNISLIKDSHDRITNYLIIFSDLTEIKAGQERIRYLAMHDALTGLPNRALFLDRLSTALVQARRSGQHLAVMLLDLDDFKRVNDSLGHETGDHILRQIADRIKDGLRAGDTVSRQGGDEFLILLGHDQRENEATLVARRLLECISQPIQASGQELHFTASIGITLFPGDGPDPATLLQNADMAMFRAKQNGGDGYQVFTPALHAKAQERLSIEGELRKAIERQEFVAHYQPRVDLRSGRIAGMEALVRWQKPGEGLVPPGKFIPVAEQSGLIVPLGELVLQQACARAVRWHQAGHRHLSLSVNLSPRQFQQANLVRMVQEVLENTGLPAFNLELEITENTVMHNVESAVAVLKSLADLGLSLSVDDFGTGYSSLYYLKHFPIQALKVDRSFVQDIGADHNNEAIVQTVVSMAQSLSLKVVAEGVETVEQLEFLRRLGCDEVQGFLFSKPLPEDEFELLLEEDAEAALAGRDYSTPR